MKFITDIKEARKKTYGTINRRRPYVEGRCVQAVSDGWSRTQCRNKATVGLYCKKHGPVDTSKTFPMFQYRFGRLTQVDVVKETDTRIEIVQREGSTYRQDKQGWYRTAEQALREHIDGCAKHIAEIEADKQKACELLAEVLRK